MAKKFGTRLHVLHITTAKELQLFSNMLSLEEKRITDGKVPLVLDFTDGNRCNHKYDNLRMLCFNCSFLLNGNLTGPKKEYEY
jgi:dihydroorotase-like cyclic amidohydrolase